MSPAKPIRVAVLAHDGKLLGYVNRKPGNANWRMLGKAPRVRVHRDAPFQECRSSLPEHDAGWRVVLDESDRHPTDLEAP